MAVQSQERSLFPTNGITTIRLNGWLARATRLASIPLRNLYRFVCDIPLRIAYGSGDFAELVAASNHPRVAIQL